MLCGLCTPLTAGRELERPMNSRHHTMEHMLRQTLGLKCNVPYVLQPRIYAET